MPIAQIIYPKVLYYKKYNFFQFLIKEGGLAFCPALCGEGQQTCAGPTDPKNGNQIGPDLCIPEKAGNCMMHCPVSCPEGMTVCPGPMGPDNCPTPALCYPMATGCPAAA